jgi:hypothetical protein
MMQLQLLLVFVNTEKKKYGELDRGKNGEYNLGNIRQFIYNCNFDFLMFVTRTHFSLNLMFAGMACSGA